MSVAATAAFFEAHPLAWQPGVVCLAAQIVLTSYFKWFAPRGPWKDAPGFTAHQVVCLPLMVFFCWAGMRAWFFPDADEVALGSSAILRVTGMHPVGYMLAQVVFSELLLWDLPTGLAVASLREPVMLAHHAGMALVALITLGGVAGPTTVGCYYAVFFFGVIEVSSIPLVFVDLFHPKHGSWAALEERGGDGWSAWLPVGVLAARAIFAALYLVTRAAYFPYVIAKYVNFDIMEALAAHPSEADSGLRMMLYGMMVFGIAFALLQLHWAVLVVRQVVKVARGGDKKAGNRKRQD